LASKYLRGSSAKIGSIKERYMRSFLRGSILFCLLSLVNANFAWGQLTRTINSSGAWSTASIWAGSAIADEIGENAVMDNGVAVTVPVSYTIGHMTMNNNNTLTINASVAFNIGNTGAGNSRDLTASNGGTLNVYGNVTIWGNLSVSNNFNLKVFPGGSLVIKGNLAMNNGGVLIISGNVAVAGNFVGGNDTAIEVNGTVNITGSIAVGTSSTAIGTGSISTGGACIGSTSFCNSATLPIELLFFTGKQVGKVIKLDWATGSESNLSYFIIQKSFDNIDFFNLNTIYVSGNSSSRKDYSFEDLNPIVGKNYYRLVEVDLDGFTKTFEIISINADVEKKYLLYPNPVIDQEVTLTLNFMSEKPSHILILDTFGGIVFKTSSMEQEIKLPVSLSKGIYFVVYTNDQFKQTTKLIVK